MNFDELHGEGCLKALPMRAWLKPTGAAVPSHANPAWVVEDQWKSEDEKPLPVGLALRLLKLDGVQCCAIQGRAITPGEGSPRDEEERAVVYLLSPAEPGVWQAIDSWVQVGSISVMTGPRRMHGTSVSKDDMAVLEARFAEGEELESDMLAGAIRKLVEAGQLEAEVARQLDIKVPLYCAVVETPMLLKSLQPVDEEAWRQHKERERQKWVNEGIWS